MVLELLEFLQIFVENFIPTAPTAILKKNLRLNNNLMFPCRNVWELLIGQFSIMFAALDFSNYTYTVIANRRFSV